MHDMQTMRIPIDMAYLKKILLLKTHGEILFRGKKISQWLHFVSQHYFDDWTDKYFRIVDELNLSVHVNARDKLGRTPLYLTMQYGSKKEVESLLRRGADPNLADSRGFTPVHKFCASSVESYRVALMKLFFELGAELNRPVKVDALDELGRRPLHYAVADLYPQVVDVLLDHGADVSNFVFPTEQDFDLFHKMGYELKYESKYNLVSRAVSVINMLEKRGRELYRSEALIVTKFFAKRGLFEKSAHLEANNWYKDEELFASKVKEVMLKTDLSLYDLMRLPAREAEKLCTKTNYFELIMLGSVTRGWEQWCRLPAATSEACLMHLCDKMSRRFFRDWALDPFYELIHKRLPILCCEMIVDNLMNEDLCNIFLAVVDRSEK